MGLANRVQCESMQIEMRGVMQVRTEVGENRILGHLLIYQEVKEAEKELAGG